MSREFWRSFVVGLAIVGVALGIGWYLNLSSQARLEGEILKVRRIGQADGSTAVVIDLRVSNPSSRPFVISDVHVFVEDENGVEHKGMVVSEINARRLFQYYPILGPKYNESLAFKSEIGPRQTVDRMLAVRFEIPADTFDRRRALKVQITEMDGAQSEIVQRLYESFWDRIIFWR